MAKKRTNVDGVVIGAFFFWQIASVQNLLKVGVAFFSFDVEKLFDFSGWGELWFVELLFL